MCPRVLCEGERMLPIGMSDWPLQFSVNVFCPRCMETYFHKSKLGDEQLDGACIGTTFPHLFLLLHSEYAPIEVAPRAPPQVYGFKIHKDSDYFKFR